jgi:hypothetical protein
MREMRGSFRNPLYVTFRARTALFLSIYSTNIQPFSLKRTKLRLKSLRRKFLCMPKSLRCGLHSCGTCRGSLQTRYCCLLLPLHVLLNNIAQNSKARDTALHVHWQVNMPKGQKVKAVDYADTLFCEGARRLQALFQQTPPTITIKDITSVGGGALPACGIRRLQRNIFLGPLLSTEQAPSCPQLALGGPHARMQAPLAGLYRST